METLPEVIIAAGPNVSVYDAETGNVIVSFKESNLASKTLSLVGEDYMIAAVENEPKIKVWTVSKLKTPENGTFICRGVVNTLAVSSCGTYCIAGIKEEIHIWRVNSGELLNVISRHYQDISCLKFSSDDSLFLSGGKDGHVVTWILCEVIAANTERDQVKPRFTWNHHSSEITDIFVGALGFFSRVATTSLDMTCKIYELDSGILLSTICLDVPLTSVVMDTMEYYLFLGAINGCIYKIHTYDRLPREMHFADLTRVQFKVHKDKISCLSISLDGGKLMSASEDKSCRLWDVVSMACLLTLPIEGGVTNAFIALKPAALPNEDLKPQFVVRPFQREFDDHRNGIRKFTDSNAISQPITLKNILGSDEAYSLQAKFVKATQEEMSQEDQKCFEGMFQESLHGGMVHELKNLNNQLYAHLIERGMEYLSDEEKSD